jgi:hypothetical protein
VGQLFQPPRNKLSTPSADSRNGVRTLPRQPKTPGFPPAAGGPASSEETDEVTIPAYSFDYDGIKALAGQLGWKVEDLLALTADNDPYYIGRPGQRVVGEWFAALWHRFDMKPGTHLRRIHYVLVSQDPPVLLPPCQGKAAGEGKLFRNSEACWKVLVQSSKPARYLGLVPLDAIEDHRNPPPRLFAPATGMGNPEIRASLIVPAGVDDVWLPETPTLRLPGYHVSGSAGQRYHIEIWAEKSTVNDVLVPLCERHGVNLVTGLGEMSIPSVRDLICRIARVGKPARVLYISDFDPAGRSMPCAVARKSQWLVANENLDLDLRLHSIVLTPAQIAAFGLPRVPIKETERRRAKFEERHGEGAVELDALEALHPGELGRIVAGEIARFRDDTLEQRLREAKSLVRAALWPIERQVHAQHEDALARLRGEYDDIAERMDEWRRRVRAVQTAIAADLEDAMPEIAPVPAPQAAIADEPEALFDSRRSYAEQLFAYKRHGNGINGQEEAQLDALRQACRAMGLGDDDEDDEDDEADDDDDEADDDDDDDDDDPPLIA